MSKRQEVSDRIKEILGTTGDTKEKLSANEVEEIAYLARDICNDARGILNIVRDINK